ncbi:hypothetical protein [Rubritalea tangerina]|uniref:hypothetical protein n=1 Tax=Rubritalea tangerina TaxID=430798 RepID=UPI00360B4794
MHPRHSPVHRDSCHATRGSKHDGTQPPQHAYQFWYPHHDGRHRTRLFTARDRYPDGLGLQPKHPAQVIAWAAAAYIHIYIIISIYPRSGWTRTMAQASASRKTKPAYRQ